MIDRDPMPFPLAIQVGTEHLGMAISNKLDSDAGLTAVEGPVLGIWNRVDTGTPHAQILPAPSPECRAHSESRYTCLNNL